MKARLLTINGPLGSGKSWIIRQMTEGSKCLMFQGIARYPVDFKDPLRKAVYGLLDIPDSYPYDLFKTNLYMGISGRQWMIKLSEDFAKQINPMFFSEVLYASILRKVDGRGFGQAIFMSDSNGFEEELMFFKSRDKIDLLTCCIEPPGSAPAGERWQEDDSRHNLSHMCDVVGPDSTTVLERTIQAMQRRGWI